MQLIQPVRTVDGNDGGLANRQKYRAIQERMRVTGIATCGECKAQGRNRSPFKTWDGLRSHLITYHGIDRREIPE